MGFTFLDQMEEDCWYRWHDELRKAQECASREEYEKHMANARKYRNEYEKMIHP